MSIWSWWRGKKAARNAQIPRPASVEPLEPRLLLSSDPIGLGPPILPSSLNEPVLCSDLGGADNEGSDNAAVSASTESQRALELFGLLPALFVENQGQWSDPAARYVHDGNGIDVAMTDAGLRFGATDTQGQILPFFAAFVGANVVRPIGLDPSAAEFHYYVGDQADWRQGVASYAVVAYEGLYEGIDLCVQGLRSHVKYEFHVAPGADYRLIAVHYEGIEGLSIAPDGSLEVNLGAGRGVIRDGAPYIYQEIDGQKVQVAGRFILLDDRTYSFEITGDIDPDHALVIDPDLIWSTYLGGGGDDSSYDIAADGSGAVYVVGWTNSSGSWQSGGFETAYQGGGDAFVVKLSSGGEHLWSTYLGGSGEDYATGIAIDDWGCVHVTGHTSSAGWTAGGFDVSLDGEDDAFVAKLNPGGALLWSCYLGGSGGDAGAGIAVDASGAVYVTGSTDSSGWVTGGPDTTYHGGGDAFLVKLSVDGEHLWSTYLGGSGEDSGADLAVDASGDIYVTGDTYSSGWVTGGLDSTYHGGGDAFVVKLSSGGEHLWSTYAGGSSTDSGSGIAVDASYLVYVTGATLSAGWVGAGFDTSYNGNWDAFVAALGPTGRCLWSTYLGGSNRDMGNGIAVDAAGNLFVTGYTQSAGWTSGGFDTSFGSAYDAFVAKLNSSGAHLWSTYLGADGYDADGYNYDIGLGIAVDSSGDIYVTGQTNSIGWTDGGCDTIWSGSYDAFVAKMWNVPDVTPPLPDPGLWSVGPYPTGPRSIRMVAATVADVNGVEYYFAELSGSPGGTDSGWQDSSTYENTGLFPGTTYVYQVKVRDGSNNPSEIARSTSYFVTIPPADITPPSPNPNMWAALPWAAGDSSIRMTAFPASDPSGVEYYFDEISGNPGGTDSGWQDSNTYEDTGLLWDTTYTYQVKTRDKSPYQNESGYSEPHSAKTSMDTTPPSPNPGVWAVEPHATGETSIRMTAMTAEDRNGVQYYFDEMTGHPGGTDSGWQESSTYEDIGLLPDTEYTYRVKVRDKWAAHNETGYSTTSSATTQPDTTPPSPNPGMWAIEPRAAGATTIRMTALRAADVSGVEYYFEETSGNPGGTDSGWQESNSYEDAGLSPGTTYTYQVRTRDKSPACNETGSSAVHSATTLTSDPLPPSPNSVWSTYLGDHSNGQTADIAVDAFGAIYVTGIAISDVLLSGGFDTTPNGGRDAFVVKFSPEGEYLWGTYLGGDSDDAGFGIVVDAFGDIYVVGYTDSAGWTIGGFDTTANGEWDVFVAKLNAQGQLLWSTYLGGYDNDAACDIAIDPLGNICVGGYTWSPGWASGGFDPTYSRDGDAFVAKLTPAGQFLWGTYLGAVGRDMVYGIAVDASADIYVTGETDSSTWMVGGLDTAVPPNGGFVAKLSSRGEHLWSTSLRSVGSGGIAVDAFGGVYVTGMTNVSGWTRNGLDTTFNGETDAFVVKLSCTGQHLWSTYLGGSGWDRGTGIAATMSGRVYVTGVSGSDQWRGYRSFDTTFNGGSVDTFVAEFNPSGECLWRVYLGGRSSDQASGIAVDAADHVYVTGSTMSSGWVAGGHCTTLYNGGDAFIVKLSDLPDTVPPTISRFVASSTVVMLGCGATFSYTVSDAGGSGLSRVELWRTDNLDSWPTEPVVQDVVWDNGPVSYGLWDSPPTAGTWWYVIRVVDGAENASPQTFSDALPLEVVTSPVWEIEPYATSSTSIRMVVTPVPLDWDCWYYFRETSGNPGGTDSGWQTDYTYQDTGLSPGSSYTYDVLVRRIVSAKYVDMYVAAALAATPGPVYRFWSPLVSHHFYTISEAEKDSVIATYAPSVWTYEGVAFYAFADDAQEGVQPVYRFWSPLTSGHFYTMSQAERDSILATYPSSVWTYEGIAYYTFAAGQQPVGSRPTYRFWSPLASGHFYTMSEDDKDSILATYPASVWTYEGIAWYVLEA